MEAKSKLYLGNDVLVLYLDWISSTIVHVFYITFNVIKTIVVILLFCVAKHVSKSHCMFLN